MENSRSLSRSLLALIAGVAVATAAAPTTASAAVPVTVAERAAATAIAATACRQPYAAKAGWPVMRPAAMRVLVPSRAQFMLVCAYKLRTSEPGGTSLRLTDVGLTGSARSIKTITDGMNAITASTKVICPESVFLGGETLTFFYRSGPSVILTVELGGSCLDVSNGYVTRPAVNAPLLSETKVFLRPVKPAVCGVEGGAASTGPLGAFRKARNGLARALCDHRGLGT